MYIFNQYFRFSKTFIKPLFFILVLALLIFPNVASAEVHITEIMYDLDGADSGREWIEVHNTNSEDVDLSDYRFLENDVNHRINIYDPDDDGLTNILPAGEHAVIADGPPKFLVDYPNFSGLLFDSSFSLLDGGEELSIVNPEGETVHSVHYLPEWGAGSTGNSLQYNGEKWIPAVPTPGKTNANQAIDETEDDDSNNQDEDNSGSGQNADQNNQSNQNNSSESSHSGQNPLSNFAHKIDLEVGSGRVRYGVINSPLDFQAISNHEKISTSEEESSTNKTPRFYWSFGDAGNNRGDKITHTYYHEGEYNLVLNADYLNQSTTSRNKVIIRKPEIQVSLTTSGKLVDILLVNQSDFEVNFGHFSFRTLKKHSENSFENQDNFNSNRLKASDNSFVIPPDTIIDANSQIKIAGELTDFKAENNQGIIMYYPNGKSAARFIKPQGSQIQDLAELEKIFNLIRQISDEANHGQIEMLFNIYKNRLNAQNRL